jgi:histone H3/H4
MAPRAVCRFTPSHIKRMMKQNEDIGKVAQAVPAMISRALELFNTMLVQKAGEVAHHRGAKTLTKEHVVEVIKEDPRLDFLSHLVGGVKQELGSEDEVKTKDIVKEEPNNDEHVGTYLDIETSPDESTEQDNSNEMKSLGLIFEQESR